MNCPRCHTANPDDAKICLNCSALLGAARRVEGERKFVSVLFADVVSSTAIAERLDPEDFIEVMLGSPLSPAKMPRSLAGRIAARSGSESL